MADRKLYYINANSILAPHDETADSVKMLSFKINTLELTETKLSHLIDGAEALNEHLHDLRYVPLTGRFSIRTIQSGENLEIPIRNQMVVASRMWIDGKITLNGDLAVV